MSEEMKMPQQRAEILRLAIAIMHYCADAYLGSEYPISHCDETFLCAAVLIGQVEGRPMNAGQLAAYIGMPRPSVIRKLKALEQSGFVLSDGGKYSLPVEKLNDPSIVEGTDGLIQKIKLAAERLSRLDT